MSFLHRRALKRYGITQTHAVSIERDLKVRMPDGAALLTDVYLGAGGGRAPVIVVRSPYGKGVSFASSTAYPLAARGYNVVMQSCRGTFGSEGTFNPHHDEQRDGLATLDWVKKQPWYGGAIATFGPSYLGYTQWAVAAEAGPEVVAMAMQVTLSDFAKMNYAGGGLMLENALSWTQLVTLLKRRPLQFMLRLLLARVTQRPMIRDDQWRILPLDSMDKLVLGERVGFWQDWTEHASAHDPWWASMSHTASIARIKRPISMVAGWYDIFLPFQMQDFIALRSAGCPARITIGPWRHTDQALTQAGLHDAIDWFEVHLRGAPDTTDQPVKLFVNGEDRWRSFAAWPPPEAASTAWYLQPAGALSPQPAPESAPDTYRYDPADPTPAVGGPALAMAPYAVDNRALEARDDVLTYTSQPLSEAYTVIGTPTAELFVTSTTPSADFFVRVCEVDPQGVSTNICDGLRRAQLDPTGGPQRVEVELWPTAYRFRPGHRIRVQVSSGAFPRWARNLGTTEPLGSAHKWRTSQLAIYHSPAYRSTVQFPVVPA